MENSAARLNVAQRTASIAALRSRTLDVFVIGGGVVGAGAALDAASRGLVVGIIEAQDWASGTSSRSSKLIHGGIRYLEQLDFKLVREALVERGRLLRTIAPHLVHAVPFLYPLTKPVYERAYVGAGMLLYDLFSYSGGHRPGVRFHKHLSRRQLREQLPGLGRQVYRGGLRYFDGQVDDARLVSTLVRTAVTEGAKAASRVSALHIQSGGAEPHVVLAQDEETGERFEIRARSIVNATGVWTEDSQAMLGAPGALSVTMAKGVHIVVPREKFRAEMGLIIRAGASVLYIIPWGEWWIIGTSDTPWHWDKTNPAPTSADVDYLLEQANRVMDTPLTRDDIRSVYAGLRPLVSGKARSTAKLSREHAVDVPREGIAVIAGGKLTTYRVMAKDAVDAAVAGRFPSPRSRTKGLPLLGARQLDEARTGAPELVSELGLSDAVADRLLGRYGDRIAEVLAPISEHPHLADRLRGGCGALRAEALYAVTHEGALHLRDVIERRLRLSIESNDSGYEAAQEVAELMAAELGWSAERVRDEVESYRGLIQQQRAAMDVPDDETASALLTAPR
ncbi:MAG TPA: glycerol-3-phosphate dehydrogenase/oxidase [Galbitalea sp.]|jgi:glycerol-3-phosphate dehydrogenase|nr:glycerol-3-phosphate dehydrogenase/oxidase [Galbitalea sp.]